MKEVERIINKEVKLGNTEVLGNLLIDLCQLDKKNEERVLMLYNKR